MRGVLDNFNKYERKSVVHSTPSYNLHNSRVMAIVSVHALSTGSLTLPERFFITPADQDARRTVPSLSFLIQHTTTHSGQQKTNRIVFDLGLRRDLALYPETLQKHCASRSPMTTTPDAVASLAEGNLTPSDIGTVHSLTDSLLSISNPY